MGTGQVEHEIVALEITFFLATFLLHFCLLKQIESNSYMSVSHKSGGNTDIVKLGGGN